MRVVAVSPHLDDAVFSAGGTLARLAAAGHEVTVVTVFTGSVARTTTAGQHEAIIARVGGRAYYSGKAEYWVEQDDALGRGFLVR